ncbi:hypothetical protein FRX31_003227 [Thalictrum thalictroides]|uniref:Uncharacterized protein n=1 Tax=Thalictrum thalictroides TaxID=46969 RepID=A0A7J6XE93_THATH|nr:hypothetical protein FRX31_003227 [Thalictrum thalictroides]
MNASILSLRKVAQVWYQYHPWRHFLLFKAISGLKSNLAKSNIYPIHNLASFVQCKVQHFPCKYFGVPLGALYKCKLAWDTIVEL